MDDAFSPKLDDFCDGSFRFGSLSGCNGLRPVGTFSSPGGQRQCGPMRFGGAGDERHAGPGATHSFLLLTQAWRAFTLAHSLAVSRPTGCSEVRNDSLTETESADHQRS